MSTDTRDAEAEAWPAMPAPEPEPPLWAAAIVTPGGMMTAGPFGDHFAAKGFATEAVDAGYRAEACELQSPPEVRRLLGIRQPQPEAEPCVNDRPHAPHIWAPGFA